jgi:multicomponent Na+:H+ antiporter subunit F
MSLPMLFVLIAGASALMGFYRLLAGPTATDRVVGLDILFAVAIILSLIAAWVSGRTVYLDVAIGLALVSCVATLSWARLIQVGAQAMSQGGGQVVSQDGGRGDSRGDSRGDTRGHSQGSGQDQEGGS